MRILDFNVWKKGFMKETDPKKGTKFAIRMEDFNARYLDQAKQLNSIKGVKFSIAYRSSEKTDSVIEFTELSEFAKAQNYAAYHSWPFTEFADCALMINMGCANLQAVIPYSKENIKIVSGIGKPQKPANYSGRSIE